jgi:hypothetical protein
VYSGMERRRYNMKKEMAIGMKIERGIRTGIVVEREREKEEKK